MTIKKNKSRLEVYGVNKENKAIQEKLKGLGYRWYPIKKCWTKWTTDTVEELENKLAITGENTVPTVDKNENIVANCVEDIDYGRELANDLNSEIDRLNRIINELKGAGVTGVRKAPAKKTSKIKIDLSKFASRKSKLEILKYFTVKNGYVYTTDIEKYIKVKKETIGLTVEDGIYKSINPVVKSDLSISEAVALPNPTGLKKNFTSEQWKEIKNAIIEVTPVVKKKNFTPILTGILLRGNKVVGTDSYGLIEVTLSFDTELNIIIPVTNIEAIKQVSGAVELTYNEKILGISNGDVETMTVLLEGNRPDYNNENIIPTEKEEHNKIEIKDIEDKIKIAKLSDDIVNIDNNVNISISQAILIKSLPYVKMSGMILYNYTGSKKIVIRKLRN